MVRPNQPTAVASAGKVSRPRRHQAAHHLHLLLALYGLPFLGARLCSRLLAARRCSLTFLSHRHHILSGQNPTTLQRSVKKNLRTLRDVYLGKSTRDGRNAHDARIVS